MTRINITRQMFSSNLNEQNHMLRSKCSSSPIRFASNTILPKDLGKYIDHTKLTYKDNENPGDSVRALCYEAGDNKFFAVCVRPDMIDLAKKELRNTNVKVATVIGFPGKKTTLAEQKIFPSIGDYSLENKIKEAQKAIAEGADELDLVMNVRQFLGEDKNPVSTKLEFEAVKNIAGTKVLKVILETDLLTPEQIVKVTQVCVKSGVDIIKTSTGMVEGGKGATVDNVRLIRNALDQVGMADKIGIKASGGIKTLDDAIQLIKAGATRLGTSNGLAIINGLSGQTGY